MFRNWLIVGFLVAFLPTSVFSQQTSTSDVTSEIPDFLLFDDDFSIEEGVFSDEFEDGKPSSAWFVYDSQYFADPSVAAPRDPRIPHEQATIYDDPINAQEIEGVLQIEGSMIPPGAGPDAAMVYDPQDLRRYKIFTMDPLRGQFQAEIKVVLRGKTFSRAQFLFFVREHDWKFDGAREARLVVFGHTSNEIQYEPNWNQQEHFKVQLRSPRIEIEDNFTVQLRRTEDNQIQVWTSEDDSDFEFQSRLGPVIETDMVDLIIGVMADGTGDQPGAVTFDSIIIRGTEIPDVEEGSENQALIDYRESVREDYEIDAAGRFDYGPAAIAANRAYTWMHYMGTNTLYPKVLLPGLPQGQNQAALRIPEPGVPVDPESKEAFEALLDSQPFPRGDRRYLDQAHVKYQEAAQLDPLYGTIQKQMEWLHDVAYERLVRLLGVFRMRTGNAPLEGGTVVGPGLQVTKADYDRFVGDDTQANQWDSRIVLFEGTLSKEAKAQVLALPEPLAVDFMRQYFGFAAEIRRPVDLLGRIPFLFDETWMSIPLTLYVPDISQEVLARLGVGFGVAPVGGIGVPSAAAFPGQQGISGFQGLPGQAPFGGTTTTAGSYSQIDPSILMGRGYTVVEYYGASLGLSDMIVRDELGRIEPEATAEKAFPWLRDFPGLTPLIAEIIDPDQKGSVVLDWEFSFADLPSIAGVPRSGIRPKSLQPPDILYDETEIPLLINIDNPEIPRRFTFADYFGWDLGPEGVYREPETPNHIAAFDSPALPETATGQ